MLPELRLSTIGPQDRVVVVVLGHERSVRLVDVPEPDGGEIDPLDGRTHTGLVEVADEAAGDCHHIGVTGRPCGDRRPSTPCRSSIE